MIFAAIPLVAAPSGKNFGFMSIGAFGFIAVFAYDLFKKQSWLPVSSLYRYPALIFCIILLAAHIPKAAAAKLIAPKALPVVLKSVANPNGLNNVALSADSDVIIVNAPCVYSTCILPFNAAYYNRPIPESLRALAYAYTGLEIQRTEERTLVIKSNEADLFTSDQQSPLHFSHFFMAFDRLFLNPHLFEKQRKFDAKGMTVDILELDKNNLPKTIACTFDVSLDDTEFCWLQFNWRTFSYEPFKLPEVGKSVVVDGPPAVSFGNAVRFLLH
jgi:hypothetical protein